MFKEKEMVLFFSIFGKEIKQEEITAIGGGSGTFFLNDESKKKLDLVKKYLFLLKIIPFVKQIFVCNTVSFGCAKKNSDIDLFFVIKDGKIFTARLVGTFLIHIFGLRRNGKNIKNRFCLSFWSSEKGIRNLEKIQIEKNGDLYLAIWTSLLLPVFENNYFEELKKSNSWIKNYNLSFVYKKNLEQKKIFIGIISFFLKKIIEIIFYFSLFEKFFKFIQIKKIKKSLKKVKNPYGIIINDDYLKFHENDIRKEIYEKFIKNLKNI